MKTSTLLAGHAERVAEAAQKPSTAIPTETIKAYNMGNFKPAADVVRAELMRAFLTLPDNSEHRPAVFIDARGPFDEVTPVTHSLDEEEDNDHG